MLKKAVVVLAAAALAVTAMSCKREIKPSKKGVFVVSRGQLFELQPIMLDTEFTDEGFARTFFTIEPKVAVKGSDFYFILYGSYKPFELRKFQFYGQRYEEDTLSGTFSLQTRGMEGEREMFRAMATIPLPVGAYVLDVTQADSTLHFIFRSE